MGLISSCFFCFSLHPKIGFVFLSFLFANLFWSFFLVILFRFAFFFKSSFVAQFIFFLLHQILAGYFFLERDKFNLQRVNQNWQWIFPKMLLGFLYVTLSGLVRVSITRCRWKDLSLLTLLLTVSYMRKENMHRSIETKTTKAVPHLEKATTIYNGNRTTKLRKTTEGITYRSS